MGNCGTVKTEIVLESLSLQFFGRSRRDAVCVTCGSDRVRPEHFRDALSRKEWKKSRMCQSCQDEFFDE